MPTTDLISPFVVSCAGGLTLNKDVFSMAPGEALILENFEPDIKGGYRRVGGTAFFLYTLSVLFASLTPLVLKEMTPREFIVFAVPGYVLGVAVLPVAWLAWWGAVEPLPKHRQVQEKKDETQEYICAICQQAISDDVLTGCKYGKCGRAFHVGCRQAREMVYRGPGSFCEVCQDKVA